MTIPAAFDDYIIPPIVHLCLQTAGFKDGTRLIKNEADQSQPRFLRTVVSLIFRA